MGENICKSCNQSVRDLYPQYIKNYHNSTIKRQTSNFFNGQIIWINISPKKIYKWEQHLKRFSKSFVVQFSSVALRPHELQHARPPCPSPTPGVHSDSRPSSRWYHPTISSSVIPFSSHVQSFPASGFFQMSQHFASGGQSIGVSASAPVLPINIQDWSPLGWTGWISLQSKGLSSVFSNTTVQKHQFFSVRLSLWSNSHIHTWLLLAK